MKEEILRKEIELLMLQLEEINYKILWSRLGIDHNDILRSQKNVINKLISLKKKVLN